MSKKKCFEVTLRNWDECKGTKGFGRVLTFKVWAKNLGNAVFRAFSARERDSRGGDCRTAHVQKVCELSPLEQLAREADD